ncbi:MAG: stalk domain-containing protein [Firmicutes bacterium]|nr:stalk domain-containing protein [Bacillota bacterium]
MRKIRSWLVIPALALTMSLCKFLPVFADQDISVYVNYLGISLDQKPVIENDRLLVPLRAIAENLKLTVCYEDSTKTITAANKAHMIVLTIGSAEAVVDGKTVILDAPAKIINGRTMVPLRFIGESLGLYVEWDGLNRQVDVIEYDYMLSRAVWKDFDYDKAKYCLEMGANPNSSKISPPLSNRCNSNNAEMLKLLFDYGLDPNAVRISKPENEQMITSFACCPEACVFLFVNPSNIDCLKLFIEYGLDLSIKDKFGRTPIDIATERWNKNPQDTDAYELVSLLSSAKQQASPLCSKRRRCGIPRKTIGQFHISF